MKVRGHWFRSISSGILIIFMGLMIYVTYLSFTRRSGSTGQDVAQIQKIRYEALKPDATSTIR